MSVVKPNLQNFFCEHRVIILIVAGSFLLSLMYAFAFRIHPVVDARAYDQIAVNLTRGFGFREDAAQSYQFDTAILRAGPGYEFFLAGIYRMFGHSLEAVWIIQALLHALSALLLFLIARRVVKAQGETVGLVAAFLFGFWPDLIEISAMLMTETLYLFLTILILYLFVLVYERTKNIWLALLFGLLTGLAILTRPPIVLFVPIVLFLYYQKKNFFSGAAYLTSLALSLFPWAWRNWMIYHQIIPTTLIGEYNLWVGNTLSSNGGQFDSGINPVTGYLAAHGALGLAAAAHHAFFQFIFSHPVIFVELTAVRLIRIISLVRPMGFWFYQSGLGQMMFVGLSGIWIAAMFLFGTIGFLHLLKKERGMWWYFIAFALTTPLTLLPTVVQSRYRFPLYPFLALGAAAAWVVFAKQISWRDRAVRAAIITFAGATAIDILFNSQVIWERLLGFFLH